MGEQPCVGYEMKMLMPVRGGERKPTSKTQGRKHGTSSRRGQCKRGAEPSINLIRQAMGGVDRDNMKHSWVP